MTEDEFEKGVHNEANHFHDRGGYDGFVAGAKWARFEMRDELKELHGATRFVVPDELWAELEKVKGRAESYRAILAEFVKFYDEQYYPAEGNMPLDIYEQARAALGGEVKE
jgi:hypothetical protein